VPALQPCALAPSHRGVTSRLRAHLRLQIRPGTHALVPLIASDSWGCRRCHGLWCMPTSGATSSRKRVENAFIWCPQSRRAQHLSSLIVGLAPPRIASQPAGGASQAVEAEESDDDFAEDAADGGAAVPHQQQQHGGGGDAAGAQQGDGGGGSGVFGAPRQAGGGGVGPQKFVGRKPDAAGWAPFAALPAAPFGQLPDARAAAAQAAAGGGQLGGVTETQRAVTQPASQRGGTKQPGGGIGGSHGGDRPAAGPEQGVVADDGLNDGQRTAVHRSAQLMRSASSHCSTP